MSQLPSISDSQPIKELKADLFGKIELIRLADGSLAVSRNYRVSRRWVRPLAYFLAAREKKILKILEPLNEPRLPRDRKSTRLNSSHSQQSRMPSSA